MHIALSPPTPNFNVELSARTLGVRKKKLVRASLVPRRTYTTLKLGSGGSHADISSKAHKRLFRKHREGIGSKTFLSWCFVLSLVAVASCCCVACVYIDIK